MQVGQLKKVLERMCNSSSQAWSVQVINKEIECTITTKLNFASRVHFPHCQCRYISHIPKDDRYFILTKLDDKTGSYARKNLTFVRTDNKCLLTLADENKNLTLINFLKNSSDHCMCLGDPINKKPHGSICLLGDQKTIRYLCQQRRLISKSNTNTTDILDDLVEVDTNISNKQLLKNIETFYKKKNIRLGYNCQDGVGKKLFCKKLSYLLGVYYPKEKYKFYDLLFPGGKRRFGESTEECALREFYEETLINIDHFKHLLMPSNKTDMQLFTLCLPEDVFIGSDKSEIIIFNQ